MYQPKPILSTLTLDSAAVDIILFAENCFKGVMTKDGYPYIQHCYTVANFAVTLAEQFKLQDKVNLHHLWIAALCHDIVEDCPASAALELEQFLVDYSGGTDLFDVICNYLTHYSPEQSREEYIQKIIDCNLIMAFLIKMADLIHNSLISRSKSKDSSKEIKRIQKYFNEYSLIFTAFETKFLLPQGDIV